MCCTSQCSRSILCVASASGRQADTPDGSQPISVRLPHQLPSPLVAESAPSIQRRVLPITHTPRVITWRQAAPDVHAASLDGEFAGFIAGLHDPYLLHGSRAEPLGSYASLPAAKAALKVSVRRTAPGRPHFHGPRVGVAGAVKRTAHSGPGTQRKIDMATGTVKWFNSDKGYGFIAPSDGSADVFAHFSAIVETGGRRDLYEGQQVEFDTERGQKGLQATNIRAL